MWTLYNKAKIYSRLPHELVGLADAWHAYQFDNAVTLLGVTVENALQERRNAGTAKQPDWQPTYTLRQLLDEEHRLPAPASEERNGLAGLFNMPGVKRLKVKNG